jgi:pimeloyl-ACP methyl ester carboxylesterase
MHLDAVLSNARIGATHERTRLTAPCDPVAMMRMRLVALVLLLPLLQACISNAQRIDDRARAAGLVRSIVTGEGYRHVVYSNLPASTSTSQPLVIFLEGDGRPWTDDGQQPSSDPTTRNPLALELMIRTTAPSMYVGRPCYQQLMDAGCAPRLWTGGRYSEDVVASMASVIRSSATARSAPGVTLVGYSGGGVLAVLIAERVEHIDAVITIGANLDLDGWSEAHGYLPLTESLNPARSERPHPWPEIHYHGANDRIVPPATATAYFARYPAARHEVIDGYDHTCCWVDAWPAMFKF